MYQNRLDTIGDIIETKQPLLLAIKNHFIIQKKNRTIMKKMK